MGKNGVWCVLLVGFLLVASVEGDDRSAHLSLKPSAGEAGGVMVAKGGLPATRFSICDVWCEDRRPNVNHRLCVQNLCPFDKATKVLPTRYYLCELLLLISYYSYSSWALHSPSSHRAPLLLILMWTTTSTSVSTTAGNNGSLLPYLHGKRCH
ncbi:hypothetical protein ACQJBY_014559 [Aegilops geniculata]